MRMGVGFGFPLAPAAPIGGTLYMLDEVAGGAAMYSFDPKSAAYSSPTAVVYQSGSPNDVYSSDDVKALLAGGQCYLGTWYDQSGNGYDLVQGTGANQPEILEDANGYLYADCVSGRFVQCTSFMGATTNTTMHIVWQTVSNDAGSPGMNSFQGAIDFAASSAGNIFQAWWQSTQAPFLSNVGYSPFDWIDRKPRQHTYKWLSGTESMWEFGSGTAHTNTTTNPTFARLTVGKNDFSNGNFRIYELGFFSINADEATITAVHKNNFPLMYNIGTFRLNMGASNTAAGYSNLAAQWTKKVYDSKSYTGTHFSRALGGRRIQDFLDGSEYLETLFNQFTFTSATINIFLGTNDLYTDSVSGATAYSKLEALADVFIALAAAKGVTLTINAVTMLPRVNSGGFTTTERNAFNTLLLANSNGKFTNVVDTTANANLQDETNSTYFHPDQTHLTDTGQTELANTIAATI